MASKTPYSLQDVPLSAIKVRPGHNPRKNVATGEEFTELVRSIESRGLLQPILLRSTKTPGQWYLIDGERRYTACDRLGLKTVPAMCFPWRPEEVAAKDDKIAAVIANMHRKDLTQIETAEAMHELVKAGMTRKQIAAALSKAENTISAYLQLLDLPEATKSLIKQREIPTSLARPMVQAQRRGVSSLEIDRIAKGAAVDKVPSYQSEAALHRAIEKAGRQVPGVAACADESVLIKWAVSKYGSVPAALKELRTLVEGEAQS